MSYILSSSTTGVKSLLGGSFDSSSSSSSPSFCAVGAPTLRLIFVSADDGNSPPKGNEFFGARKITFN